MRNGGEVRGERVGGSAGQQQYPPIESILLSLDIERRFEFHSSLMCGQPSLDGRTGLGNQLGVAVNVADEVKNTYDTYVSRARRAMPHMPPNRQTREKHERCANVARNKTGRKEQNEGMSMR